jgi:hypothetical protein
MKNKDVLRTLNEKMKSKSEVKIKQFHELDETELDELKERCYKRAVRNNRELLWDVRCVYEPEN